MTIKELIEKVKIEKPNTFTDEHLLQFVNEVEADVAEELRMLDFENYTEADMDEELIVDKPYNGLYESYLKAKIDYANEEYASYQLNQEQYAQDFSDFANWVVRTGQALENIMPSRFRNFM